MQAKRFVAADMRRALDMVKEEFGEDALIVSTERTGRGVEIVASLEAEFQTMVENNDLATMSVSPHQQNIANAASRFTTSPMPITPVGGKSSIGIASGKTPEQLADEMEIANRRMIASRKAESMTIGEWANQPENNVTAPTVAAQRPSSHVNDSVQNDEIKRLHDEIADMRHTIEDQLLHMSETQERQYIESMSHVSLPAYYA